MTAHHLPAYFAIRALALFVFAEPMVASERTSAQTSGTQEQLIQVQVTGSDHDVAKDARHRVHTAGSLRPQGGRHPSTSFGNDGWGSLVKAPTRRSTPQPVFYVGPGITRPGLPAPGFYPGDMYQFTPPGPVVTSAEIHNVYVNCTPDCWANPAIFQNNLLNSGLIHVVDQYVGASQNQRYTLGASALVTYRVAGPLSDSDDIASIVHAAGRKFGVGYGHIQYVFLPKGVDVCMAASALTPAACYSPDNAATWTICSYHGFLDFPDIGHVLYAVIPYPDDFTIVNGAPFYACDVGQANPTVNTAPTPNGVLVDSTSHLISHETLETITDPDFDAWLSLFEDTFGNNPFLLPGEIGDLCANLSFLYTPFEVNGVLYYIAPAYSNKYHLCASIP